MKSFSAKKIQLPQIIFYSLLVIFSCAVEGCYSQSNSSKQNTVMDTANHKKNSVYSNTDTNKITLSNDQWKNILSPEVYNIAREKGTERPYTSKYEHFSEIGTYYCAACGNALFKSDTKFESGCGWPSFYQPINKGSVIYSQDNSYG